MKWNELTPEQKNALVAEKVLGRSIDRSMTWSRLLIFHTGNTGLTEEIPRYTTNMDAAWHVLQHIASQFNPESRYDYEPFNTFTNTLFATGNEEMYPSHNFMAKIAKWTPEQICIAALHAIGVEVE